MDGRRRNRKEQRLARERVRATGEPYTSALAHVRSGKEVRVSKGELSNEMSGKVEGLGEAIASHLLKGGGKNEVAPEVAPEPELAGFDLSRRVSMLEEQIGAATREGDQQEVLRLVQEHGEAVRARVADMLENPPEIPSPRPLVQVEAETEALISAGLKTQEARDRLRALLEERESAILQEMVMQAPLDVEDEGNESVTEVRQSIRDLVHEMTPTDEDRRRRLERIRERRPKKVEGIKAELEELHDELHTSMATGLSSPGEREVFAAVLDRFVTYGKLLGTWDWEEVVKTDDGSKRSIPEVEQDLEDLLNRGVPADEDKARMHELVGEYLSAVALAGARRRKRAIERWDQEVQDRLERPEGGEVRLAGVSRLRRRRASRMLAPEDVEEVQPVDGSTGLPVMDWEKLAAEMRPSAEDVLSNNSRLRGLAEATRRRHAESWEGSRREGLIVKIVTSICHQVLPVLLSLPVDPQAGYPQLLDEAGHLQACLSPDTFHGGAGGYVLNLFPPDRLLGHRTILLANEREVDMEQLSKFSVDQLEALDRSLAWLLTGQIVDPMVATTSAEGAPAAG